MKCFDLQGLLLCLIMHSYCKMANACVSETRIIAGIEWGSMKTSLKIPGVPYYMEEDLFLPGNILISGLKTLRTADTSKTHLIVGSEQDYAEGISAGAMFSSITGFIQINASFVLLVDQFNNCLRYVNRQTNQTSPAFGICRLSGLKDGQFNNARFNWPRAIKRNPNIQDSGIVTDNYNKAIRSINLVTGDVKTLIKDLPEKPRSVSFDSKAESAYIIFEHSLGKFEFATSKYSELIPSVNKGGLDGDFRSAYFESAEEILCVHNVCLVTDWGGKIRILQMDYQIMSSICSGTTASVDGSTEKCSLFHPWSLLLRSDTLYIGEYYAIRSIAVRKEFSCRNITVAVPVGKAVKCVEVFHGHDICLPPGIYNYSISEKRCTIKINITKEADACRNLPCLNSGICTAEDNNTYSCACRGGWTGRNCQNEIDACTFRPCQNFGRCFMVNSTFRCSCVAGWTGVTCETEFANKTCRQDMYHAGDPKTMNATIILPCGDNITLPVGRYIYGKNLPDNTTCETKLHIFDPRLRMRLDISADYKLPCNLISDYKELIQSIAETRYSHIKKLSSGFCNQSDDFVIKIECTQDVLQVIWPTNCLFNDSMTKQKESTLSIVDENLKNMKEIALDLFIPNRKPPIVLPYHNREGLPASVLLTPVCTDGLRYMQSTETCH